jgi:CheY-like chemotaxis protein
MVNAADILNASILIVDAQEASVLLLKQMLDEAGYMSITSTKDPHAVCKLHRKNRYDLILLDLEIPDIDGCRIMEGLKQIEPADYLPVLAITTHPKHKLQALKDGVKDFISKPFDLPEVLMRIHYLLEVRLLHRESKRPSRMLEQTVIQEPQEAAHQGQLILVAEDNETNQQLMLRQLDLLGLAAEVASNGLEALERWKTGAYALLLTDVHMPFMDGYELSAAIRSEEVKAGIERSPIIGLTADATKKEKDHCKAAGMDDYLSKPVRLTVLKAMLDKWLQTVRLPIEVRVLKEQVGNDLAFISEFLHIFRSTALETGAEIEAAVGKGRTDTAGAAAHKLKSSARSVGAFRLGELCSKIEKAGKADDNATLEVLLPHFKVELVAVENYLVVWQGDLLRQVRQEKLMRLKQSISANSVQQTLLVVDDDVFQHKNIANALIDEKYRLLFAASGDEAMRILCKELPDLILMDVDMPGMNGLEVVRKIKMYPRLAGVSILMLTGRSEKNIILESRKAGASDFIVKPFTRDILLAKVREVLPRLSK